MKEPINLEFLLERIPHRGPMLLLDEVISASEEQIETQVTIGKDFILLDDDGLVPPLSAIEFFAQSAAALMVFRAAGGQVPFATGALLGARKLEVAGSPYRVGDTLRTVAKEVWGAGKMAQFDCRLLRDGAEVATGSITVAANV
ncbi:MAG: hypothetical protein AAGF12_22065 [Myxococcota bacterium]